jgi:hypothetical protein
MQWESKHVRHRTQDCMPLLECMLGAQSAIHFSRA